MTSSTAAAAAKAEHSRPSEVEEPTNRYFIHPMSRALVDLLIPTGISPNAVSVIGVVMAAGAAWCYATLPWPGSALVGFVFHIAWHVFDGADGTLARRTGRSSTTGEVVDGICDHLSHLVVYIALGIMAGRTIGVWAWPLTIASLASRAAQAAAYESCRRTYRWWVYGVSWIRQDLPPTPAGEPARGAWGGLQGVLGGLYLGVARMVSADDKAIGERMRRMEAEGSNRAQAARDLYRERHRPVVKRASLLSTNYETLGIFASILLAATPVWFLLYQATVLNLILWNAIAAQNRANREAAAEIDALTRP